jgi:hypothetical protein
VSTLSKIPSTPKSPHPLVSPGRFHAAAWLLGIVVSTLAVVAWRQSYGSHLPLNAYLLFPLLGLLAFSLMWTHYVVGTFRELCHIHGPVTRTYYKVTGYTVLVLLCLHPGLLIYQRYRDGYGLPPHSYESYVAPGLGWITVLGSASLLVFLAFELHRFFGRRPWWRHVQDASDLAMLAVLYHGLRLGDQLQQGWFQTVWYFYGLSFIVILIRKYYLRFFRAHD